MPVHALCINGEGLELRLAITYVHTGNAHTTFTYVGTYNVCMLFHPRMCKDEVEGYAYKY